MKKQSVILIGSVCLFLVLLCILCFFIPWQGLNEQPGSSSLSSEDNTVSVSTTTSTATTTTTTEEPYDYQELKTKRIPNTADWKTTGIKKAGLTDFHIDDAMPCDWGNVYFISRPAFYSSNMFCDVYLAVEREQEVLLTAVTSAQLPIFKTGETTFEDVDGEPGEEVIVHGCFGGNGGFSTWHTSVWKITKQEIIPLLLTPNADYEDFVTGFQAKTKVPFQLEVSNRQTGYKATFSLKARKEYVGWIFDENGGHVHLGMDAFFDSTFFEVKAKNVDNDESLELVCKQYASLYNHADYIGNAVVVLKYNNSKKTFVVADAYFEPHIED